MTADKELINRLFCQACDNMLVGLESVQYNCHYYYELLTWEHSLCCSQCLHNFVLLSLTVIDLLYKWMNWIVLELCDREKGKLTLVWCYTQINQHLILWQTGHVQNTQSYMVQHMTRRPSTVCIVPIYRSPLRQYTANCPTFFMWSTAWGDNTWFTHLFVFSLIIIHDLCHVGLLD